MRATTVAENVRHPPDPADRRPAPDDKEEDDDFQPDRVRLSDSAALASGASAELRLQPLAGYRVGHRDGTPAPVLVTTCAAGGAAIGTAPLEPRVRALPPRPLPWLRDLRLRRAGDRWRLTWRTARPAHASFLLLALDRDEELARPLITLPGRGRTRFAVSFAADRAVRTVWIELRTREWGASGDSAGVSVTPPRRGARGGP